MATFSHRLSEAAALAPGARASKLGVNKAYQFAPRAPSRCTCLAFAANHSAGEQRMIGSNGAQQQPCQEKYDRILAFVDAHATPIILDSSLGSSVSEVTSASAVQQQVTSSWHHSYDEEAEEGEELHEPAVLAMAAAVPAAAADSAGAAVAALPAWSYGDAVNPKPFFYAWDEEAEGALEWEPACSSSSSSPAAALPVDPVAAAAAARAQRRAALHEARHAARAIRRMRRAQLHPQLGDLERMPAWVQPAQQQQQQKAGQRSAAGIKYQQLLALVAGDSATGQYRVPKQWHLTFDEDVHGPEVPETVLGSC